MRSFLKEPLETSFPEMLQWLLADRFGQIAHAESRGLSGFALEFGKDGLILKPAVRDADAPAEPPSPNRLERQGQLMDRLASNDPRALGVVSMKMESGVLHAVFTRMPMEALARTLSDRLQVPVINVTGADGEYQMTLDVPPPKTAFSTMESDSEGLSLSSMLKRLGLKLEKRKIQISLLVVDHLDRVPTQN